MQSLKSGNALAALKLNLSEMNASNLRLANPDLKLLNFHVKALRKYLGEEGDPSDPVTRDRMLEAIGLFVQTGQLEGSRSKRLVASGLLIKYKDTLPPLLENEVLFPTILSEIDSARDEPRQFRKFWGGLLACYLAYGPGPNGNKNWRTLRDYLSETLDDLEGPGFIPDWVPVIRDHKNLITDDPTRRYGDDLINDDWGVVNELRKNLAVPQSSWITVSLVDSQISAIIALADHVFKSKIPALIELMMNHPLLASAALAKVLVRYSECSSPDLNVALRDYASDLWGAPWIELNAAKWGQVPGDVRRMVEGWIKRDFIEKFFALLSADGVNDPRRLKFWSACHEQINNMYFALGNDAYYHPGTDYRNLREKNRGRIIQLEHSTSDNNAFIMEIDDYIFVEFGATANACYVYTKSKLPFSLAKTYLSVKQLKNKNLAIGRLKPDGEREYGWRHADTSEGLWEDKFRAGILSLTGLKVGQATNGSEKSVAPPPLVRTKVSVQMVKSFCHLHDLKFEDLTSRGGQFWVVAANNFAGVSQDLKKWGFTYSLKRSAWYRNFK